MSFLSLFILALVQGITEFLPVSSSGHLVLVHHLLDGQVADLCWTENRSLDVAVHIGTLCAVLLYFRRDLLKILTGMKNSKSEGFRLGMLITGASVPVILAGLAVHVLQPSLLCLVEVMAWMTLIFGVVLWIADRTPERPKTIETMGWRDAILIGLAQVIALIPGTSRSGITMTAARFLGYSRTESAHFSLLLAIIAIAGAGALSLLHLLESGDAALGLDAAIAAFLAFITGYIAIALMMKWLEKSSFTVFAVYRIILGIVLLGLIYSGLFV